MELKRVYDTDKLVRDLKELNISIDDDRIKKLLRFYEMLVEWNEFMNLTAITEFDEVMVKHFVDSASIVKVLVPSNETMIDVGCGAGFPGLPLKILFPELKVTLLDSLNKRVGFLNEVIKELELKDIEAVHGRAEDIARNKDFREKYDLCISRAVANFSTLSEYCLPFIRKGGNFVAYKSEKGSSELEEAGKALSVLGGEVAKEEEFFLPGTDNGRTLYLITKVKETPGKYPRKAGTPSKDPIR